jgi:hypothetical protein
LGFNLEKVCNHGCTQMMNADNKIMGKMRLLHTGIASSFLLALTVVAAYQSLRAKSPAFNRVHPMYLRLTVLEAFN